MNKPDLPINTIEQGDCIDRMSNLPQDFVDRIITDPPFVKVKTRYHARYRITRGVISRTRKTEFVLSEIHFSCFDHDTLSKCSGSFQKNYRYADGSRRRPKVLINTAEIPDEYLIATE